MLNIRFKIKLVLPMILVMISVAESLIFKQMAITILSTILFMSQIISARTGRWTASSEATLIYISIFVVLLVVLPYIGIQQNQKSISLILYLVLFVTATGSLFRNREFDSSRNLYPLLAGFMGSVFLLILIARGIQVNGSIYPWAMSGDARNHLLVVRQTVSDGRVRIIDSYPAFGDAIVGVISGWRIDEDFAKLGKLAYEIRLLAITIVMYLGGIGFLSSRSVSRGLRTNATFIFIAAGVMSFVMLSQFWLENYLRWGFMSSGMVVLVCIALYNVLTSRETPFGILIFYFSVAILVVLTTFPIMVGAVAGLAFGPLISGSKRFRNTYKNKLILVASLTAPFVILWVLTPHLPLQGYMQGKLNIPGGITAVNPKLTLLFVVAFALILLVGKHSTLNLAVSGLTLSLSTLIIDKYLDFVLTETYYLQKFRWLSLFLICIILCTCLVSVYLETHNLSFRIGLASLCAFATLLFVCPVLQEFSSKNYVKSMAQSWEYPTLQEARKIVDANTRAPRAVFWQASPDYLSTQIMNMWLMMGIEEIRSKSDIVLWTYQRDQFSLQTICEFALDNKPITIWVQTPEVEKVVKPFCNNSRIQVRSVDRAANG